VENEVAQLLLGSILQGSLVFFCGAGLSMADPSCVPSAARLAELCADDYDRLGLRIPLPATARQNLGELAEFFFSNGQFDLFINRLVRWYLFCGDANWGHTTIADFLTCGACLCAITTNFDILIERAAVPLGERALKAALDGDEANVDRGYRPLLKIHGCVSQRDCTLWCARQLHESSTDPASLMLKARLESSRGWMRATLRTRLLVLVGFWSDWKYLNDVFLESVRGIHATEVLLIDPATRAELEGKAPDLWAWARTFGRHFRHVQERAEVFLRELQEEFSRNILWRVLNDAAAASPEVCSDFSVVSNALAGLDSNVLYALRRDFAGVPIGRVAKWKEPHQGMHAVAKAHLSMISSGARLEGPSYVTTSGKRVRVVNGFTLPMNKVKSDYLDEPAKGTPDDFVICAGVDSDAGHASIVPRATPSIVRPGSVAEWLTMEKARERGIL
jgi:SIR2-like domain